MAASEEKDEEREHDVLVGVADRCDSAADKSLRSEKVGGLKEDY